MVGLLEAVAIFVARVRTRLVLESVHPNKTGPTARLTARCQRASSSLSITKKFHSFQAGSAGTVKKILVKKGQKIDGDDLMLEIE